MTGGLFKMADAPKVWVFLVLAQFLTIFVVAKSQLGTVYMKNGQASFEPGVFDKQRGAAVGNFTGTLNVTGWDILKVTAGYGFKGPKLLDQHVMYASGYLEGYLTSERIYQHWKNINSSLLSFNATRKFVNNIETFLDSQLKWAAEMVQRDAGRTPFWRHVSYILAQLDGVYAGYNDAASKLRHVPKLPKFAFEFLNGEGDFVDIRQAVDKKNRPNFEKMTRKEVQNYVLRNSRCSAMIRATGAYENIFMSHSTWFLYSSMMRCYKHYDFNLRDRTAINKQVSFSSYPGMIISVDDFYTMANGLVMLQTTNNVFNTTLYDHVKPSSILAWQRVRIANMMAKGGKEWGHYFSLENSGTYNNQYMIIDLKKIKLGHDIEDGALYVVEQIPTLVVYADQTKMLRNGHWPSYNIPFYESIYNMSGYPYVVALKGLEFSYQMAPRAKIFRRDADKVETMDDMMRFMRYNDYHHDPYSENDPCKTICCRGDLSGDHKSPTMGCFDTKVTDYKMAWKRQAYAINGPTTGTDLAPFSWKAPFMDSHIGMPKTYNFKFVKMGPNGM